MSSQERQRSPDDGEVAFDSHTKNPTSEPRMFKLMQEGRKTAEIRVKSQSGSYNLELGSSAHGAAKNRACFNESNLLKNYSLRKSSQSGVQVQQNHSAEMLYQKVNALQGTGANNPRTQTSFLDFIKPN